MRISIVIISIFISSVVAQAQDTVKLFVALWDSPPETDLYWGKIYGVKPYFSNDDNWEIIRTTHPGGTVQKQILFWNKR